MEEYEGSQRKQLKALVVSWTTEQKRITSNTEKWSLVVRRPALKGLSLSPHSEVV